SRRNGARVATGSLERFRVVTRLARATCHGAREEGKRAAEAVEPDARSRRFPYVLERLRRSDHRRCAAGHLADDRRALCGHPGRQDLLRTADAGRRHGPRSPCVRGPPGRTHVSLAPDDLLLQQSAERFSLKASRRTGEGEAAGAVRAPPKRGSRSFGHRTGGGTISLAPRVSPASPWEE